MEKLFLPKVVITTGDPAGIGPDIILSSLMQDFEAKVAVVGDTDVMTSRAKKLGLSIKVREIHGCQDLRPHAAGTISIIHKSCAEVVQMGVLNPGNSSQVIDCIDSATMLCQSGAFDAMVTAPVNKAVINDAGIPFSGHTEWIALKCDHATPVMMLANESLRVCLATTHLPLAKVPDAITIEKLTNVLTIMHDDISRLYAFDKHGRGPRIGVCGLNPHAGEGGYLGNEEINVILPAIESLNEHGYNLIGPLPADTAFTKEQLKSLDAVLAMYHDQGLPVIKHQGFGEVVNVTLGLPIIRTSVDHGTALDLAGSGKANASSLCSAINLAIKFANNRII